MFFSLGGQICLRRYPFILKKSKKYQENIYNLEECNMFLRMRILLAFQRELKLHLNKLALRYVKNFLFFRQWKSTLDKSPFPHEENQKQWRQLSIRATVALVDVLFCSQNFLRRVKQWVWYNNCYKQ